MSNSIFTLGFAMAVAATLGVVAVQSGVEQLDAATRQQCATQAWPVHQHQAHVDFCRTYLADR